MTDPNNALSVTRILSLQRTNETNVLITFPTVAGRTYTLRSAPTLTNAFTNTGLPAQPGTGSPRTFTNTVGTNIVSRFYKVQAGLSGVVAAVVKLRPLLLNRRRGVVSPACESGAMGASGDWPDRVYAGLPSGQGTAKKSAKSPTDEIVLKP